MTTSSNSANQAKDSSHPDAYDVSFTDLSLSDQVSLLSSFLLVTETQPGKWLLLPFPWA